MADPLLIAVLGTTRLSSPLANQDTPPYWHVIQLRQPPTGGVVKRFETHIRINQPITWGGYIGTYYKGY